MTAQAPVRERNRGLLRLLLAVAASLAAGTVLYVSFFGRS